MPINVGLSGAQATDATSGGPFDVMSDIVFSGASASYTPYDPFAVTTTQTPTSSATGQGTAAANAPAGSLLGATGLLGGVATSSSSVYLWIALAVAGGAGIWLLMRHKK